jgi:hypothetical protein
MVLHSGLFWQERIHPWEVEWEIALGLKRISQYSNNQLILLVGEGDFSFSLALATAFGAAHNIVATSLDSRGEANFFYSFISFLLCLCPLLQTIWCCGHGINYLLSINPKP